MDKLERARQTIDEVDRKMAELFEQRMNAVKSVAEYKAQKGIAIFDPEREKQVVEKNGALVADDEIRGYYRLFMQGVMAVSRAMQQKLMGKMKVAYCGVEGAFAHLAAQKIFSEAEKVAYADFDGAFAAVERGDCDAAILPLENSYAGEVGQVTDLAFDGELFINGVFDFAINQNLIGLNGVTADEITEVISHPQALAQCAEFIRAHNYKQTEFANTALAAKHVKQLNKRNVATIASENAAELYGLSIIASKINRDRSNTTRFAVFSRSEGRPTRNKHFIMVFTVCHKAGALASATDVIGSNGFNMRVLRSRPIKGKAWSYYFYVEAEGDINGEAGKKMLSQLSEVCDKVKVIGSYDYTGEVY